MGIIDNLSEILKLTMLETGDEMNEDKSEILRYLGYGGKEADDGVLKMIEESMTELLAVSAMKQVHVELPLTFGTNGSIFIDSTEIVSKDLTENLVGCHRIIVFAATLGIGVDNLIRKYSRVHIAKAVILQACAAAVIERYCDEVQLNIDTECAKDGLFLRPRFSPGYGDFSITHQKDIVNILQCGKKIGINLTESLLLVPTKSVTAVIGISNENIKCNKKGCRECLKTDCNFKKEMMR